MKNKIICAFFCYLIIPGLVWGHIYFKGSDHELEVIRVKGREPGLTLLVFGGIHGDEPGGYFSSEILCDIDLKKGNLIIVPRVNFPGVMTNRREIYGDMNRKFIDKEYPKDPDAGVIKILKGLMQESDIFINQHDAYGFHRDKYISKNYNPYRYGQCLIVDTGRFYSKKLKREINLAEMGKRIVDRVNTQIKKEKYHFGFWNHNSVAEDTKFIEMQKSATYYALVKYSIPAFGLETSKDLPTLYHKVKHQLLMIKEILNEFGLEFTSLPAPFVRQPLLYWVEFIKNGKDIIRVNSNTNIRLNPGDTIEVSKIFSNYDTGLSADILKWGSLNDINKNFTFKTHTRIIVKKNQFIIGRVNLRGFLKQSLREITVDVNGEITAIPNWGKIEVAEGHYFNIKETTPGYKNSKIDVRGFSLIPGKKDDSHVNIYTRDLIKKYSFRGKGEVYFVKIYKGGRFAGGFQVHYRSPEVSPNHTFSI